MEPNDWENQTVLNCRKYIFGNTFSKNVNRLVTSSENVLAGKKFDQSVCLILVVTCFLFFFRIVAHTLNYTQEDTSVPKFVQIGRASAENRCLKKRRKSEPTA